MSLQIAAQHLASKGRNGDSMLVHMTPGEVGGLQTLAMAHGGSLTINPDTGLPEANVLKALLPTLLGAGLAMIPGVGPLMAAGIVGGGTALATKDLGQGIMAGLGAFGGAGLGSSLVGATSAGAQAAGTQAMAGEVARQATQDAALQNVVGTLPSAAQDVLAMTGEGITGATTLGQAGAPSIMGTEAGANAITNAYQTGMRDFASKGIGEQLKGSLGSLTEPGGLSAFGSNLASQYGGKAGQIAAGLGATNALSSLTAPPAMPMAPTDGKFKYEGPYTPPEREVVFPTGPRDETSEFLYFRPTNPVPGYTAYAAEGGPIYSPDANMNYDEGFAIGGLTALAGGGRFLQGPGDGTSDSIPAVIGNKQPARLADGEFVVDARTVSELGNGSSKAGAQKLYKMMDRIHGARKTAKRGKDSNAEKYLPA